MTTLTETVRKMILAHSKGDEAGFRAAAQEYAEGERRKNHHLVADDIARILGNGTRPASELTTLPRHLAPRDREKGTPLLSLQEPGRDLDSLVLSDSTRATLDRIVEENREFEVLRNFGLSACSRVLFCGPPGCGKTVAAEAIAQALYLPLGVVRFDSLISSYLGETAANIRKVFEFAESQPMVLLFDEVDSIARRRSAEDEHGELKRVVTALMQMMDTFRGCALTIAATNHEGLLDPALWRRFDEIVYFNRPDAHQIAILLEQKLRQSRPEPGVDLSKLATEMSGMTHADVERICIDALKRMVLERERRMTARLLQQAAGRQQVRDTITLRAECSSAIDTGEPPA